MTMLRRLPPVLLLPRGLILAASVWLVASWIICIGLRTPVQPSAASYTPGVRMMLISMAVGLMVGWPMMRLTRRATFWPVQQTVLDLAVLLALAQVVIWPLRLVTPWSAERTTAIDATFIGWAVLTAAVVASAVGSSRAGVRNLAMVACLGICLLGPTAAWLGVLTGIEASDFIAISPLLAIHQLSGEGPAPVHIETWQWLAILGAADVLVWAALLGTLALRGRTARA
jgi:hypothetical protein